jgi:hypothetical protein
VVVLPPPPRAINVFRVDMDLLTTHMYIYIFHDLWENMKYGCSVGTRQSRHDCTMNYRVVRASLLPHIVV